MKVTVVMKKAKLTVTVTMKDKPDKPKLVKPKLVKPKLVKPKIVKPKIVKPKLAKPKLVKPKLVKPKLVPPTVHDLLVKEHHKWRKEEADSWDIYNSIRARRRGSRR
jgi:hypothetical protein